MTSQCADCWPTVTQFARTTKGGRGAFPASIAREFTNRNNDRLRSGEWLHRTIASALPQTTPHKRLEKRVGSLGDDTSDSEDRPEVAKVLAVLIRERS